MLKIASALIVFDHKLLLHLRDGGHPDPNVRNKWGLVGGRIEKNEDSRSAVLREIKEESNLEPKDIHYVGRLLLKRPKQDVEIYIYSAFLTKEEANKLKLGNEGLAVTFFSPDDIKKLPLSPEVEKLYIKYQKEMDRFIETGILPKGKVSVLLK